MKVTVEMLAFGKKNELREVEIPDDIPMYTALDEVYHWGQNEHQPQPHPSVSVGDVIRWEGAKYMICPFGFRQMCEAEYKDYLKVPQTERMLVAYVVPTSKEVKKE